MNIWGCVRTRKFRGRKNNYSAVLSFFDNLEQLGANNKPKMISKVKQNTLVRNEHNKHHNILANISSKAVLLVYGSFQL